MKKLNNGGWSYITFLLILLLLLGVLLLITYLANQFDKSFPRNYYNIGIVAPKKEL